MNTQDKPRVLVTGATGFLANHIVLRLLDLGYIVRGTVRSLDCETNLRRMFAQHTERADRLELCVANLSQEHGWNDACEECEFVMHVASPFPLKLPRLESDIIRPAQEGALRVLKAASQSGVKRVVMTSSTAAILYGRDRNQIFDEKTWSNIKSKRISAYQKSKTLAEQSAWDFIESAEANGMELSVINPGLILGPVLNSECRTSATLIRKLLTGALPGLPNLGWACADVRDVADAHIVAMTKPEAAGERFICANAHSSIREIADVLRSEYGKSFKIPSIGVPDLIVKLFALIDPEARITLNDLGQRQDLDNNKAKKMLSWKSRSLDEMVIATANSLLEFDLVK